MPVTPFHFGPAYLVKEISPKYFSFRIFLLTQVIIDIESIYHVLTNQYPFHRFLHTYLGATLVTILCIIFGRPICLWLTNLWNGLSNKFKTAKIQNITISFRSAVIGAFFGGFSHIILDSIMHRDMHPFSPFNQSNQLLRIINLSQLHLLCIYTGIFGFIIYLIKKIRALRHLPPYHKKN